MKRRLLYFAVLLVVTFCNTIVFAQDLEPRLMSSVPRGGRFIIASYGHSQGNILLDNSLPLKDLEAKMDNAVLAYAGSFKLFNKLAKFDLIAPYSFAKFKGVVNSIDSSTTRTGFGDPLARLSIILIGNKPVPLSEFAKLTPKKFSLGTYVRMRFPIGQYDNTKFLNLGANRWAAKLGVVGSYAIKRKLVFEMHLLSWFFGENNDFYNGNVTSQKPMLIGQLHASYTFKPGLWLAFSIGRSAFGETSVNGIEQNNKQSNSRIGAACSYRLAKHHSVKLAYTSGFSTRYGADFDTFIVAYQFIWFKKE